MLDLYGGQQWWTGLGQAGADNVVMLLGVSLAEANEFVNILYGRQNIFSVISDKHLTMTENTGFTVEDILNNSEGEDVELKPCKVYDQVRCEGLCDIFCCHFLHFSVITKSKAKVPNFKGNFEPSYLWTGKSF